MTDKQFKDYEAGAKTIWIMQFHDDPATEGERRQGKRKAHFYIPYPENTPERKDGVWLDTTALERAKTVHEENLKKMEEFRNSIESNPELKNNFNIISEIVKRFKDILRRFT